MIKMEENYLTFIMKSQIIRKDGYIFKMPVLICKYPGIRKKMRWDLLRNSNFAHRF